MSVDWRKIPSLTALRAFDATAREGSFAGAARALNVTHAAVAQQVRGLEQELGVGLATRQGRQVVLTAAGQQLASTLANAFERIGDQIERTRLGARSRGLRVTCSPFMAERIIMPNLKDFWLLNPGAEISLSPTRDYADLAAEGFDLGIRSRHPDLRDQPGSNDLRTIHLKKVQVVGIAAPELVEKHGASSADMPWLWHDGMDLKLKMMRTGGLDVDKLRRVPIGSPNLLLEAVRGGIGMSLFTETLAQEEFSAGRVVKIDTPQPIFADYVAVLPKGQSHVLAETFAEWVRTLL
ncbi:LysR family glycine cleavage system transcriptional activator [Shimia isoporae]|uniref:LysR family glycine cleavage system transcriptional activator n=1 Tax=Shimia isoporae TaxID=647720 RepID=A0A4V2Q279_9RHOB|nr:LysR family transcriptional regulator [Shimia isoporae]TCL01481.1 LysR family glycine cleavage system transcriptional activator [Shimia isoporae]